VVPNSFDGKPQALFSLLMVAKAVSPWFHPENEESPGSGWSPEATTFATFNNGKPPARWGC